MLRRVRNGSRREVSVLLALLLIFTLFIHWGGTNAFSRYSLTTALVEDQQLEIGPYAHTTLDKIVIHPDVPSATEKRTLQDRELAEVMESPEASIYTDKPPLSPVLAIPGYVVGDAVAGVLSLPDEDVWIDTGITDTLHHVSATTALKQILIVLSVSVLFALALFLMLFRDLRRDVGEDLAVYTVMIAGLSTFLFYYATSFYGVITAATIGYAAYYLLHNYGETDRRAAYLAGILGGLTVATEYYAALIPFGLAVYLLADRRYRILARFAVGGAVGVLPLLFYNYATTGNPFVLIPFKGPGAGVLTEGACTIYSACSAEFILIFVPDLARAANVAVRLLFSPVRGLLFYSPVLLVAVPGTYELWKRHGKRVIITPGIFVLFFLFQIFELNWLAGVTFGPRHMVVGLPFLVLPMAYGIRAMGDRGRIWTAFILFLAVFSAAQMALGFTALPPIDFDQETYTERFNSVEPVQPGFYPALVEQFTTYGPRSELLMGLLFDREKTFSIDHRGPYGPPHIHLGDVGARPLLLATVGIPIVLLVLFAAIPFGRRTGTVAVGAALVVLLLALTSPSAYATDEVYRSPDGDTRSLVENEGVFALHAADADRVVHLEVGVHPPLNRSRMTLSFNGGPARNYTITGEQDVYLHDAGLREGRNRLHVTTDRCLIPAERGYDPEEGRCLSLGIKELETLSPAEAPRQVLSRGWSSLGNLSRHGAWLEEDGEIAFRAADRDIVPRVHLSEPFAADAASLNVTVNGVPQGTFATPSFYRPLTLVDAPVTEGWNTITLEHASCPATDATGRTADGTGCGRFLLHNLSLPDAREMETPVFQGRWFDPDRRGRWMKHDGDIIFDASRRGILNISLTPQSNLNGTITLTVDGAPRRRLPAREVPDDVLLPVAAADRGIGTLGVRAEDCVVPAERNISDDTRCISARLDGLSTRHTISRSRFTTGWYADGWMRRNATVLLPPGRNRTPVLNLTAVDRLNSSLAISINGKQVRTIDDRKIGQPIHLTNTTLRDGYNILRLTSTNGCITPTDHGISDDTRCISYQAEDVSLVPQSSLPDPLYRSGWYAPDTTGRWMGETGTVLVRGSEDDVARLDLTTAPTFNTSLTVSVNGEHVRTVDGDRAEHPIYLTNTTLNSTFNTITLESTGGCITPADHGISDDTRCISYRLQNITLLNQSSLPDPLYRSGWYPSDGRGRWMGENATVHFTADDGDAVTMQILPSDVLPDEGMIDLEINGKHRRTIPARPQAVTLRDHITSGHNTLTFRSTTGCTVPERVSDSTDDRCLSVRITRFTTAPRNDTPRYDGNWHPPHAEGRWLGEDGRILLWGSAGQLLRLAASPLPEIDTELEVSLNGDRVGTVPAGDPDGATEIYGAPLRSGWNVVSLNSTGGCGVPADLYGSTDTRCLSFDVRNISRTGAPLRPHGNRTIFGKRWHPPEDGGRWMQENGTVFVHQDRSTAVLNLTADVYAPMTPAPIETRYNGRTIRTRVVNDTMELTTIVEGHAGWNRIALDSRDGCLVPAEVEESNDPRCLSIRVTDVTTDDGTDLPPTYRAGWYPEETGGGESWRWMREDGIIAFGTATDRARITMDIAPYPGLSTPTLAVTVNGEPVRTLFPAERTTASFTVETDPGINRLQLQSGSGCAVPAENGDGADDRCLSFRMLNLSIEEVEGTHAGG